MFNNSNKPDVILFTYLANINILAWVAAFKNEINKTKKKEEYEEKGNNGNQITERRLCTEMNGLLNLKNYLANDLNDTLWDFNATVCLAKAQED